MLVKPKQLILFFYVALFAATPAQADEEAVSPEYRVKAAFIYNFSKFIKWPGQEDRGSDNHHHICVVGNNPFGEVLKELQKKAIHNKLIRTRSASSLNSMKGCHVIYIGKNPPVSIIKIIQHSYRHNILTVSDNSGFSRKGGVIQLLVEEKKVRFEINLQAAKESKLHISSRLLKLAWRIHKSVEK